jgi:hypothetical protein
MDDGEHKSKSLSICVVEIRFGKMPRIAASFKLEIAAENSLYSSDSAPVKK